MQKKQYLCRVKERLLHILKRYGKYIAAVGVFAVVMLFFGEQSVVNYVRRASEIHRMEAQRDMYIEGIKQAQDNINTLQNTDSLERYARERYYMHAPNEDVYILEE